MMSGLDAAGIQQLLTEGAAAGLQELEVFASIGSTNSYLMAQPAPPVGRFRVAIADHQTAGRGRHDRRWVSAPGAGLCLSIAYTFERSAAEIEGLTLAVGVGTVSALRRLDVDGISLKWPNDIVALDGKLGGILTEVQAGGAGNATVVTGIGLNVSIGETADVGAQSRWAQRPVDLESVTADPPARELLAGTLADSLYHAFRRFEEVGLAGFVDEWRRHDWLLGREITVDMPGRRATGVAAGVDDRGVLLLDTAHGQVTVISGSIALATRAGETA
jgi:BirA family biotin operon repressor/biotin-[acetyl-CoA-carboxylase] ligase